jgi:hypothetical protein
MTNYPKTTLIFFGSTTNSRYGLYRSLIAFVILAALIVSAKDTKLGETLLSHKVTTFLLLVVIVSGLTVQVPTSTYDAVKYGASVSGALSFVAAATLRLAGARATIMQSALGIFLATAIGGAISAVVYMLSKRLKWYPTERA